jgi:membrane-bound lytic murein transglycosylase D
LANYKELSAWPLAVTAYNHGRGGMAKAVRDTRTAQLGTIINNYRSPSFGFASKNFYAEFLAAARTYELVTRTGLVSARKKQPPIDILQIPRPMSVREITQITKLSPDALSKLNPCLTNTALGSKQDAPLPRSYEIRLPKQESSIMRRKFASNNSRQTYSRTNRR